jgi:hypothetical protein
MARLNILRSADVLVTGVEDALGTGIASGVDRRDVRLTAS